MAVSPFAPRDWVLAHGRTLELGPKGVLMGILNTTPDSFSEGGAFADPALAIDAGCRMAEAGADIIDVGGESTRPDAEAVDEADEIERVLPVVEALAARCEAVISVDTYKTRTARLAVEAGAHVVNDVTAMLGDANMSRVVCETGAGLVAMHNSRPEYRPQRAADPVRDQLAFADELDGRLRRAGIDQDRVVIDPGIGFGKDGDENLALLARLEELVEGRFPLLLGTSRKRFIGTVTGREPSSRDVGTAVTTAVGRMKGAAIFRVHDVAANRDALRMADALLPLEDPR